MSGGDVLLTMSFSVKVQLCHCFKVDPRALVSLRPENILNVPNSSDAVLSSQPTHTGLDAVLYAEKI